LPEGKGTEPTEEFCNEILNREEGNPWQDAQAAIQNTMTNYNCLYRSGTMAQRGIECLNYIEESMKLVAANPHEMTHCLEMRNLIECGRIIFRSTIERRESRGGVFSRLDYPNKDDVNFNCFIGQRQEGIQVVFRKINP